MSSSSELSITLIRRLHAEDEDLWLASSADQSLGPQQMRARRLERNELESNGSMKAFQESVEVAKGIHHDNITRIYGYSESQGDIYMLTEHVDGIDLSQLLARAYESSTDLDPRSVIWLIREVVRIAHELTTQTQKNNTEFGICAGLSLSRVLICHSGQVKLTGLGREAKSSKADLIMVMLNMLATLQQATPEETPLDHKPIKHRQVFSSLLSEPYSSLKDLERRLDRTFYGVYEADDELHGASAVSQLVKRLVRDDIQTDETPSTKPRTQKIDPEVFKGEFTRALESRHEPVVPQALTFADRVTGIDTTGPQYPFTQAEEAQAQASAQMPKQRPLVSPRERWELSPMASKMVWFTLGFVTAISAMILYLSAIS